MRLDDAAGARNHIQVVMRMQAAGIIKSHFLMLPLIVVERMHSALVEEVERNGRPLPTPGAPTSETMNGTGTDNVNTTSNGLDAPGGSLNHASLSRIVNAGLDSLLLEDDHAPFRRTLSPPAARPRAAVPTATDSISIPRPNRGHARSASLRGNYQDRNHDDDDVDAHTHADAVTTPFEPLS